MTKAQEVYDRVEALVATGLRKADAFKQVAEEYDAPFNSMRGAYYSHTATLGGTPARTRKTPAAAIDPIEQATSVLTTALEAIDEQVEAAKTRAEEATGLYKELRDSASERKATIKTKIEALNA